MQFDEDNGSHVGQSGVCDVDDEMPSDVIRRMGVGFFRPIEEPLMMEEEEPYSSLEEPSSSQDHLDTQGQANNENNHVSLSSNLGHDQEPLNEELVSPNDDQDLSHDIEQSHDSTLAQVGSQGEDRYHVDDQSVSQESLEEAQSHRDKWIADTPHRRSISLDNVLGSVRSKVSTRGQLANFSAHHAFISNIELLKVYEGLEDPDCVIAMLEELNNFERNKVWTLMDKPKDCKNVIGTKWIFKNKQDENDVVIRNKARLVAQGYSQVEGIEFGETFSLVAHLDSIRILIAYASHHNFVLHQMDVKSAFLYGPLHEEVYVKQPPGFEDPQFPNHVYKINKALYGLKESPRAWYEHLRELLVDHGFEIGVIDPTLFTKKVNGELFICQLYVDDIIFGSTNQSFNADFARLMTEKFEMSMMGELKFFLGFEIKQLCGGNFLNQAKYTQDMLKRFNLENLKGAKTPMLTKCNLNLDPKSKEVDHSLFHSMIGSLLYLCASRMDIVLRIGICACFQAAPKESHLVAIKRVF
jgi:hypothetical protein